MSSFLFLVSLIEKENETRNRYRFLNDNRKHLIYLNNSSMKFVVWKYDYIIHIIQIISRTLGAIFKTVVWLRYLNTPNFSCQISMPLKDDMCNYAKTLKQMFLVNSKHLWEKVSRVWILTDDLSAPHVKPTHKLFALHARDKNGKFL